MLVRTILNGKSEGTPPLTISVGQYVSEAARLLSTRKVGAVVALDRTGCIAGIVSERDIVRCLAQQGQTIACMNVSEVMTTEVLICHETDHVNRVVKSMTEKRIRHVPVVDDHHRLVGMITIGDIIKTMLYDNLPEETVPLCEYSRHRILKVAAGG